MLAPASAGGAGGGTWGSAGRSMDTFTDPPFPVRNFIREYGAYLDSWRFATMRMKGDTGSVWDIRSWRNCDTALSARKKRWWHWGGRGALPCRGTSPGDDNPFVRCFDEVHYEKSLGNVLLPIGSLRCPMFRPQLNCLFSPAFRVFLSPLELDLLRMRM